MAPRPGLIIHVAALSQLIPPLAFAWSRSGIPPRAWTSLAMITSLAGDAVLFFMSRAGIRNLWVGYISTAVTGILVVAALTGWQVSARAVRASRIILILYVLMWAITSALEDTSQHSLFAIPIHSVLVLLFSVWTLVSNAMQDRLQPTPKSDWFWVCLGLALLYGASSAMQPLLRIFLSQGQVTDAVAVLNFKAAIQVIALLLISVGMLCPIPARSGPSSSPVP